MTIEDKINYYLRLMDFTPKQAKDWMEAWHSRFNARPIDMPKDVVLNYLERLEKEWYAL